MSAFLAWAQHYGIVAVVAVFVLIFVTTYWPARRERVEQLGRIPLEDDR